MEKKEVRMKQKILFRGTCDTEENGIILFDTLITIIITTYGLISVLFLFSSLLRSSGDLNMQYKDFFSNLTKYEKQIPIFYRYK